MDDGPNTYAYVGGNPVNYIDPLGLYGTTADNWCRQNPAACAAVFGGGAVAANVPNALNQSSSGGGSNSNGTVSGGGGTGDYCLQNPNDPLCQNQQQNQQCPSTSSQKFWGHTFNRHGQGAKNLRRLTGRAGSGNPQQGQWLNNQQAANHIYGQMGPLKVGPNVISIPQGLGRVVTANGQTRSATHALVVIRSNGTINTAYPVILP